MLDIVFHINGYQKSTTRKERKQKFNLYLVFAFFVLSFVFCPVYYFSSLIHYVLFFQTLTFSLHMYESTGSYLT